jgi:hypothetical protein
MHDLHYQQQIDTLSSAPSLVEERRRKREVDILICMLLTLDSALVGDLGDVYTPRLGSLSLQIVRRNSILNLRSLGQVLRQCAAIHPTSVPRVWHRPIKRPVDCADLEEFYRLDHLHLHLYNRRHVCWTSQDFEEVGWLANLAAWLNLLIMFIV